MYLMVNDSYTQGTTILIRVYGHLSAGFVRYFRYKVKFYKNIKWKERRVKKNAVKSETFIAHRHNNVRVSIVIGFYTSQHV